MLRCPTAGIVYATGPGDDLMVDFETVRTLALALPGTQERPSYGMPAFRVGDKLFVRLREDGEQIVIRVGFLERDALLAENRELFSITPHYQDSPMVLVRLATVEAEELQELLITAWRFTAPKRLLAAYNAGS